MLPVIEGIRAAAARDASAPALITEYRLIDYGELIELVARVSNYIADSGLPRLSKIFLNIADSDIRAIVMIAAMHAGMVPFALLQRGNADDLGPHIVVGAGAPQIPDLPADLVLGQTVFSQGDVHLRDFGDRADTDILYVGSTTGTTGLRRLVAEPYGTSKKRDALTTVLNLGPADRAMCTVGDMTSGGVRLLRIALSAGATHVRQPKGAERSLRLINDLGVSHLQTTPSTLAELLNVMEATGLGCRSLRQIHIFGGLFQKRLVERVERYLSADLVVAYGSTEAGMISAGQVRASTFEVGYVGEPYSRMTIVSSGTREDPQRVAVVDPDGGYRPYYDAGNLVPSAQGLITLPDIGYLKGQSLYLLGRDDEVYNVSGNKTAFSLIEQDLLALPGVADVGIVGGVAVADPAALLVAVSGDQALDVRHLAERIHRVARVPTAAEARIHVFRVHQVPRNAAGKVDREAIVRTYKESGQANSI